MLAAWLSAPCAGLPVRTAPVPLVLFLCRSNSVLSIMAEAILRHWAQGRVRAASAGDGPVAHVDPYALRCLRERGMATTGLRSKGCDAFFGAYRPAVRFLITLSEVRGATPNWDLDTIRPTTAHWGMPDPSTVVGSETQIRVAFEEAFGTLDVRIRRFLALPLGSLRGRSLTYELRRIGETT